MSRTQFARPGTKALSVKKMVTLAMLGAMAYLLMVMTHVIPMAPLDFLKYDAKDVIIMIGGFMYGPFHAALISVVVSLIEMVTVSSTGVIGFAMNVLSTCSFVCGAAWIYKRRPSIGSAVLGLITGCLLMALVMLLWNYLITPLYMGVPRETVVGMLAPVFLPYNLLKGGVNAAVTMIIYKPVVAGLRRASLLPVSESVSQKRSMSWVPPVISLLALAALVVCTLLFMGVLKAG